MLINIAKEIGLIVNNDEWWHFYDDSLLEYGMKFNYYNSDFIPVAKKRVLFYVMNNGGKSMKLFRI